MALVVTPLRLSADNAIEDKIIPAIQAMSASRDVATWRIWVRARQGLALRYVLILLLPQDQRLDADSQISSGDMYAGALVGTGIQVDYEFMPAQETFDPVFYDPGVELVSDALEGLDNALDSTIHMVGGKIIVVFPPDMMNSELEQIATYLQSVVAQSVMVENFGTFEVVDSRERWRQVPTCFEPSPGQLTVAMQENGISGSLSYELRATPGHIAGSAEIVVDSSVTDAAASGFRDLLGSYSQCAYGLDFSLSRRVRFVLGPDDRRSDQYPIVSNWFNPSYQPYVLGSGYFWDDNTYYYDFDIDLPLEMLPQLISEIETSFRLQEIDVVRVRY